MATETSNKKKGIKRGWRNRLRKLPEDKGVSCINENNVFDSDDSFSSVESEGGTLGDVGPSSSKSAVAEFRWSIKPDEGISFSPNQRKSMKNNRFSMFEDEGLYLSDEFHLTDAIIMENDASSRNDEFNDEANVEHQAVHADVRYRTDEVKAADEIAFENEIVARDVPLSRKSERKSSTASKMKKAKKKKSKVGSTEKRSSSKSKSSKKASDSSSKKSSKAKSRGSSKSLSATSKETSKKDKMKKKKKKSLRQSPDAVSGCDDSQMKINIPKIETRVDTLVEDSIEELRGCSDVASKAPRTVPLLTRTDSLGDTAETEASTEVEDQFDTVPPINTMNERNENAIQNPLWSPRLSPRRSQRHSMLQNKIRASLASIGERSAISALTMENGSPRISHLLSPRPSDRHSILKNKIRASLVSLGEKSAVSGLMMEPGSPRSTELSRDSRRLSQTPSGQAFLDAFHTEDRDSVLGRLSVQDKDLMENLLNELQHYEVLLEEERNDISKERCMMQLKQEAVEQMLEMEVDKNLELESQVLDLQERLDHYETEKEDNELVQTIQMLETEVELLRQKAERQDQTMASMAIKARRSEGSHRGSTVSIQRLPVKEQGELLMLRSAFEEQAKELAKMKEQIRSAKEDQTVEELKQALKNEKQQKKYFVKETERLKKMLGKESKKSNQKKSKGWFGISDDDDCLLDLADTNNNMVFGSVSDIGNFAVVPENDDDFSSSWIGNNSSSNWMAMSSDTLQSSSSLMGMSSDDSLHADACY